MKVKKHIHKIEYIWDSDGPAWLCDICKEDFYERRNTIAFISSANEIEFVDFFRWILVSRMVIPLPRWLWIKNA